MHPFETKHCKIPWEGQSRVGTLEYPGQLQVRVELRTGYLGYRLQLYSTLSKTGYLKYWATRSLQGVFPVC